MATRTECKHQRKDEKGYPIGWGSIDVEYCLDCGLVLREWECDTFGQILGERKGDSRMFEKVILDSGCDGSLDYARPAREGNKDSNGKTEPVKEAITHPKPGRKIQAGSVCPACQANLMCINGLLSADLRNYAASCNGCGAVLCSTCGRKPHHLRSGKYICSHCSGGLEVIIAFSLDAERVRLTVAEAHRAGQPLPEEELIERARRKLSRK